MRFRACLRPCWPILKRPIPLPPRLLVWSRSYTTALYSSSWDGTSWSTAATGPTLPDEATWIALANAPTRDEIALITVDYNNTVCGLFYTGGSFTSPTTLYGATNEFYTRPVHVAYEQQSGEVLSVYGRGANFDVGYRTASGTAWQAEHTFNIGATEHIRWTRLYPKPKSDEMILATVDYGDYARAAVWDGSSFGNAIDLSGFSTVCEGEHVAVAYESLSGDALIVYGNGTTSPQSRIYSSGSWSPPISMNVGIAVPRFVKLASKPNSDEIVCAVLNLNSSTSSSFRLLLYVWNGSAWVGGAMQAVGNTGYADRRPFDLAYEPDGSHALVAYSNNQVTMRYRTWNGSTWSSQLAGPVLSAKPQFIALTPGTSGNEIFLAVSDLSAKPLRRPLGRLGLVLAHHARNRQRWRRHH
jgi:hypothetical protein